MAKELRVNQGIRAREVLVVGELGEKLGVMPLSQALQIAKERNIDLVEVAPTAAPPVCRLFDYGKFKYEQAKKKKQAHKSQADAGLREVRMRPKIDEHDVEFKIRLVKRLLDKGSKVKVSVRFRGREITHPQIGRALLEKVSDAVEAGVDRPLVMEGRSLTIILSPASAKRPKKES